MVKKYFSGFTLIELMIAVSIIAILVLLVINTFISQIAKGNDAKRKADLERIKVAVEEYEKDHNCYPATVVCPTDVGLSPYLKNIPCDPVTKTQYYYEPDPDNPSCPRWFRIYTVLQNTGDLSLIPGIGLGDAYNYYRSSENAPVIASGVTPTAPPGGLYGCKGGLCVPIDYDPLRPPHGGGKCDPNFGDSSCGSGGCTGPYASQECVDVVYVP